MDLLGGGGRLRSTMTAGPGELFDRISALYERYAEITDDIYRPWLVSTIPDNGGRGRALDLGCGSGRFDGLLSERYAEVLAVDIAEGQVSLARQRRARPNVRYEVRDIREVTAERDGTFELVFSVNSLFHLRDYDRVLPHIRSLVAPGGLMVVIDVVNPPGRTRAWHRWQAGRVAGLTLLRHRSPAEALDVLRLRLSSTWLLHVSLNVPLTRPDFHRRFGAAFAGAAFDDGIDPFLCGMRWKRGQA